MLNRVAGEDASSSRSTRTPPTSKRLLYIGTNNYEAGKALGERDRASCCRRAARWRCSSARFSADNAAQRLKGIEDAIAGHNIEIVEKREDKTDRAKARSNVEDIVNARPDLNLVVRPLVVQRPRHRRGARGHWARRARCWRPCSTRRTARSKGIKSGTIAATVVQKPFEFGYLSAQVDARAGHRLRRRRRPRSRRTASIDTGVEVIDKDNVAEFEKRLAEMEEVAASA